MLVFIESLMILLEKLRGCLFLISKKMILSKVLVFTVNISLEETLETPDITLGLHINKAWEYSIP